ncbi:inositol monophosphatase family protein [Qipengyuania soli]|uniref:Histidinol phosphate phosphatase n=1 Tax=Qipengyuania soli TaxID=2782568 RepID=A0A7S8F3U8_9SPHN|nr:inositol monophosphatase family protein [Qipengyuania soli]QPC98590.1 histidinol phosphate phosphatase [Qipengyuania soli]
MVTPKDIELANRLADAAGEAIRPLFRGDWQVEHKDDHTAVTVADRAAEEAMRRIVEAERPTEGIIGEEFGSLRDGASRQWVFDPIDGTQSFVAGRPIFGTLIALLQDGWPVLGVIDQPILGERWVGAIGEGTTFNGRPIRTRACGALAGASVATTSPHAFADEEVDAYLRVVAKAYPKRPYPVYGGDCYNYALLASGHLDLVMESGLKLHDYAALVPVVEGAGGMMADWQGHPLDAGSDGTVIALGDPARLEDVLEAMSGA